MPEASTTQVSPLLHRHHNDISSCGGVPAPSIDCRSKSSADNLIEGPRRDDGRCCPNILRMVGRTPKKSNSVV
ncbi:hypothetical protein M407DRAFT_161424 [Tulasnella calospora MUT 4182]|uniref:Uncharacterized protein n=1 Tax=Tulasnella calospora MUT 4182 TaxID=1051891 RepID=A0A0C3QP25_9AGAM|nr:hypothetical protein M407DRAFT_161424 [Tulasnella calospora MUT 4182]